MLSLGIVLVVAVVGWGLYYYKYKHSGFLFVCFIHTRISTVVWRVDLALVGFFLCGSHSLRKSSSSVSVFVIVHFSTVFVTRPLARVSSSSS